MRLINIYDYSKDFRLTCLYSLLNERKPHQNISHKEMPTFEQHEAFVERKPYAVWYFFCPADNLDLVYGSIYLTFDREIGIWVFEKYQHYGVGTMAIEALMEIHPPPLYANIAPENDGSQRFFEKLGFRHIQNTYALEE